MDVQIYIDIEDRDKRLIVDGPLPLFVELLRLLAPEKRENLEARTGADNANLEVQDGNGKQ